MNLGHSRHSVRTRRSIDLMLIVTGLVALVLIAVNLVLGTEQVAVLLMLALLPIALIARSFRSLRASRDGLGRDGHHAPVAPGA